jgi:hypothetical protein
MFIPGFSIYGYLRRNNNDLEFGKEVYSARKLLNIIAYLVVNISFWLDNLWSSCIQRGEDDVVVRLKISPLLSALQRTEGDE